MAKATPIPTAQRALNTAIKALESISISTGIKGTAIKLGSEFVTDVDSVVADLIAVQKDAEELVTGLKTMTEKLQQSTNNAQPQSQVLELAAPGLSEDDIPAIKEQLEYAMSSPTSFVPERQPATEVFPSAPEF